MARDFGHQISGLGPKQPVELVAKSIVDCIRRPRAEVFPHRPSRMLAVINIVAPAFTDRLVRKYGRHRDTAIPQASQVSEPPLEIAARIAREVRAAGGRALIVGGWVRDRLLGQPSKDVDIEVFGIDAEALRTLLGRIARSTRSARTSPSTRSPASTSPCPDANPRSDAAIAGSPSPGNPRLSPREAARRRDFTINAITWDPLTDEYINPFDGGSDLRARLLRALDRETFADDSLRALRAIQFAARFELTVEQGTKEICRRIPLAPDVTRTRTRATASGCGSSRRLARAKGSPR